MGQTLQQTAGRELRKLTTHLSPLSQLDDCEHARGGAAEQWRGADAGESYSVAVAATGFRARGATSGLSTPTAAADACEQSVGSSGWVDCPGVPGGFDAELALRCAVSCPGWRTIGRPRPDLRQTTRMLRRDLAAEGLDLGGEESCPRE